MNISIIGTGNVASVLAKLILQHHHSIQQIIGRNEQEGKMLAEASNASFTTFSGDVNQSVDLVLVCLSDHSLSHALADLHFGDIPVVHTAGAVSMNVLQAVSSNYAVLYPLQSLHKGMTVIPPIPFLLEANSEDCFNFIKQFADTLSDSVLYMEEEKRIRMHAAAVIVNNFTNYLYGVAERFCISEAIDFNLLKPLIKETADRIQAHSPLEVQTGPAKRSDIATIDKHLRILHDHPKLKILYTKLTDGIMNGYGL